MKLCREFKAIDLSCLFRVSGVEISRHASDISNFIKTRVNGGATTKLMM